MDGNSIIDRTTFEVCTHAEDHSKVFICDKPIAPVIALLNKKGYKTFSSCSGHYKLEEYQKNERIIIKKVKDNSFDYWREVDKTHIYILFADEYKFANLPSGFEIGTNDGLDHLRPYIECEINYYDKNNEHKKRIDVLNEIDNKCNLLKEWVVSLPNIKQK